MGGGGENPFSDRQIDFPKSSIQLVHAMRYGTNPWNYRLRLHLPTPATEGQRSCRMFCNGLRSKRSEFVGGGKARLLFNPFLF